MEAPFEQTERGLVCKGEGWFVVNARDARLRRGGEGRFSNFGGDTLVDQLGIGISVLAPREPMSSHHWETRHVIVGGPIVVFGRGGASAGPTGRSGGRLD